MDETCDLFMDIKDTSVELRCTGPNGQYRGSYLQDGVIHHISITRFEDKQTVHVIVVKKGQVAHDQMHEPNKSQFSILLYANILNRSYVYVE